jgi:hypothetical protein
MNLRSLLAATFGAAFLMQVAAPASAITLINENFNSATTANNLTSGIPSFNVTSGNVDVLGARTNKRINLNGNQAGTLTSSVFNFNPNNLFTLSFDFGNNGSGTKNADIFIGSSKIASFLSDTGEPDSDSFSRNFQFSTPISGALSFVSTSAGGTGVIIDNVQLSSTPTAVPEPTAIPGLVLFGGAAVVLRRKQLARNAKAKFDS